MEAYTYQDSQHLLQGSWTNEAQRYVRLEHRYHDPTSSVTDIVIPADIVESVVHQLRTPRPDTPLGHGTRFVLDNYVFRYTYRLASDDWSLEVIRPDPSPLNNDRPRNNGEIFVDDIDRFCHWLLHYFCPQRMLQPATENVSLQERLRRRR